MDPIFEHPVFDSTREKVTCVIRQLEKPQEALKTRCILVLNVGETRCFLSENKSGLLMRE